MITKGQRHFIDSNLNNSANLIPLAASLSKKVLMEEFKYEMSRDTALLDSSESGWCRVLENEIMNRMRESHR